MESPLNSNMDHQDCPVCNNDVSGQLLDSWSLPDAREHVDLLVIGAGPHNQTVLSRVFEEEPDTAVDAKHPQPRKKKEVFKRFHTAFDAGKYAKKLEKILVVDPSGEWNKRWQTQFKGLQIDTLRSAISMHADPFSFDSILLYAELKGRKRDLVPITALDRSLFYRGPYSLPKTTVFNDHAKTLVHHYGLDRRLKKAKVVRLVPIFEEESSPVLDECCSSDCVEIKKKGRFLHFEAILDSGKVIVCKKALIGIGSTNTKNIPQWVSMLNGQEYPPERLIHAWDAVNTVLADPLFRLDGQHVLLVGCGLTSVYLTKVARSRGAQKVTIMLRGQTKIRQFDVDVCWLGRMRKQSLHMFSQIPLHERPTVLAKSRDGGSIPLDAFEELEAMRVEGFVEIMEQTEVGYIEWMADQGRWTVDTSPNNTTHEFDHVWLATGSKVNAQEEPLFADLMKHFPVDVFGGLPALLPNLQWRSDCPVWVCGAYASLQLGPGALNIVGARTASVRIRPSLRSALFSSPLN